MSRRRGSATALKLSEVVAARDMSQLYVDMGICQWFNSGRALVMRPKQTLAASGEAFTPQDHAFNLSLLSVGRGPGQCRRSGASSLARQSLWLVLNRRTLAVTFPVTTEPALVSAG